MLEAGEREGATGYFVTLGQLRLVDVRDDHAYVAVPATMMFKVHGKQVTQTGSTFTAALHKLAVGVAENGMGVDEGALVAIRTSAIGRALRPAMSFGLTRDQCMKFMDSIIVRLRYA